MDPNSLLDVSRANVFLEKKFVIKQIVWIPQPQLMRSHFIPVYHATVKITMRPCVFEMEKHFQMLALQGEII